MKSKVWKKLFNKKQSLSSNVSQTSETEIILPNEISSTKTNVINVDDESLNQFASPKDSNSILTKSSSTLDFFNHPYVNHKEFRNSQMGNTFSLKPSFKSNQDTFQNHENNYKHDHHFSVRAMEGSAHLDKSVDKFNAHKKSFNKLNVLSMECYNKANDLLTTRYNTIPNSYFSSLRTDNIKLLDNLSCQSEMELKPCLICKRTFVPETLEKHVRICEKWATKKRKIFDSSRQRREGTEMAAFLPKDFGLSNNKTILNNSIVEQTTSSISGPENRIDTKCSLSSHCDKIEEKQQLILHHQTQKHTLKTPTNSTSGNNQRKSLSPTSRMTAAQNVEIKARAEARRHLAPASAQCPECGRHFGIKAYDRHVEFCKEKSKIAQFKGITSSQAKERLEARTKYKAPNLRLKRAAVRDKYSINGDDGHEENHMDDFLSISNSLSSSFMSDGESSDKYDPFLSAKRQLEDLCSATSTNKHKFEEKKSPKIPFTPKITFNYNTKVTNQQIIKFPMSSSYSGPSTSSINPENPLRTLNITKSNFKRTSSLRAPRKTTPTRTIFAPTQLRPSTIHRGISDEGPISTKFLKPEEYDEMPVKSACINNFASSKNVRLKRDCSPRPTVISDSSRESSPKTLSGEPSTVIRRSPVANLNRRNLRLNLNTDDENISLEVKKTDSLAVFLKYENELIRGLPDLINHGDGIKETNSSSNIRTSSSPKPLVSEKDLKDKTNILSKKNSNKNSVNDIEIDNNLNYESNKIVAKSNTKHSEQHYINRNTTNFGSRPRTAETCLSVNKVLPTKLEPLSKAIVMKNCILNHCNPLKSPSLFSNQHNNILSPIDISVKHLNKSNSSNNNYNFNKNGINLISIFSNQSYSNDNDNFIDSKLINQCDNLNITSLDSVDDTNSNLGHNSSNKKKIVSNENKDCFNTKNNKDQIEINQFLSEIRNMQQDQLSTCSRNSAISEKNSKLFNRQIRLGKNQFLYEASPSECESSPQNIIENEKDSINYNVTDSNSNNIADKITMQSTPLIQTSTCLLSPFEDENEFDSLISQNSKEIFNNFDFEEFLSSFEDNNDDNDESFPGLKDCKKFLMKRCLNLRSNNNFKNPLSNYNMYLNETPCDSVRSNKSETEQNLENNKRSQNENEKHEIFISIETDQNENEESLDVNSCASDPSIMNNPLVEEVNGNDNKFTKIETYSLPIFEEDKDNALGDFEIKSIPIGKILNNNKRDEKNNVQNDNLENIMEKENNTLKSYSYQGDSGNISSVDSYPMDRENVKSKTCLDSTYRSFTQNITPALDQNLKNTINSREKLKVTSTFNKMSNEYEPKSKLIIRRKCELNASSSGSENSLSTTITKSPNQKSMIKFFNPQKTSSIKDISIYPSYQTHIKNSENINYNFEKTTSTKDLSIDAKPILSKFCYECGCKFLVSTAKFCMECGVKRLAVD